MGGCSHLAIKNNLCDPLCLLCGSLCNKFLRTYTEAHRGITELPREDKL